MLDIKRPTNMTTEESAELLFALEEAGITKGHLKQVSVNKGLAREIAVLLNEYLEGDLAYVYTLILSPKEQIEVWKKANRQGQLGIGSNEFNLISSPPPLSLRDREDGFVGTCLFYGFGDGDEYSDLILSGKKAWDCIGLLRKTWKSPRADFDDHRFLKARDDAAARPLGFYWKKIQLGYARRDMSVEGNTDNLEGDWRMGPEGIQFLLAHPHYIKELGISELIPNIALPEFEVLSEVGNGFTQTVSLMLDRGRTMLSLIAESKGEKDLNFGFGTLRD